MKKLVVFAAALALLTGCAADSSSTGSSADSTTTLPHPFPVRPETRNPVSMRIIRFTTASRHCRKSRI